MIRGLGTVVVMVAFIGLALWVFSPKRKSEFEDATLLPFADDPEAIKHDEQASRSNKECLRSGVCTSQSSVWVPFSP